MDYSRSLNLPETKFPMRANLPEREPEILQYWKDKDVYKMKQQLAADRPKWVLHDGPPYANGNIHIGTALNKIIKDIIIKFKYATGYNAPYIPGWDTHGLPIEHAALKILGIDRHKVDPLDIRHECKKYAYKCLDDQRKDFIRLGVSGDWENPYVTLVPAFEAKQIEVFGEMAKKDFIYKGLKSVYWCPHCETALAEAEIEYAEKKSPTIFVKFKLSDGKGKIPANIDPDKVFAVIWTTTPWTMPANVAVAVHPEFTYSWIKNGEEIYFIAEGLLPAFLKQAGISDIETLGTVQGIDLEGIEFKHPFIDRISPVVLADYVTLEQGTGCVHTAPGHGQEDFETGVRYNLPIVCPVDAAGKFTAEAGKYEGLVVQDSNGIIIKDLAESGALLAKGSIRHQYAHCWRCKQPIIYRATEQWFASIDGFREQALQAIDEVKWIPTWGKERIHNMVADRHDWCISRQRVWGVPIPIFYCNSCGEHIINDDTIKVVAELFGKEGSDAWWTYSAKEILPDGFTCPHCGHDEFRKESDIMDVWFDSGSTHRAVLTQRPELKWPADMYLEGSDQHRGWFQSSLLTSTATQGRAPYEAVLTHGFVVDGEGRKMSKSVGNVIFPQEVIKKYGADILRLWVASAEYKADIRISDGILKQLSEVYRKIRNTLRYILGNLNDFNPNTDKVAYNDLLELDKWALLRLQEVTRKVHQAYEDYEFHLLYHTVHNFCSVELSAFYLDVLKDRLYSSVPNSIERRAAQTVMYEILKQLVVLLTPVLSFTTEEVWNYMPKEKGMPESVQFALWPKENKLYENPEIAEKWEHLLAIRSEITKSLELSRRNKIIGHSLDASVELYADAEIFDRLKAVEEDLATILIVSHVKLVKGIDLVSNDGWKSDEMPLVVVVKPAVGEKCERCWIYSETVGKDESHPSLCKRCAEVIEKL